MRLIGRNKGGRDDSVEELRESTRRIQNSITELANTRRSGGEALIRVHRSIEASLSEIAKSQGFESEALGEINSVIDSSVSRLLRLHNERRNVIHEIHSSLRELEHLSEPGERYDGPKSLEHKKPIYRLIKGGISAFVASALLLVVGGMVNTLFGVQGDTAKHQYTVKSELLRSLVRELSDIEVAAINLGQSVLLSERTSADLKGVEGLGSLSQPQAETLLIDVNSITLRMRKLMFPTEWSDLNNEAGFASNYAFYELFALSACLEAAILEDTGRYYGKDKELIDSRIRSSIAESVSKGYISEDNGKIISQSASIERPCGPNFDTVAFQRLRTRAKEEAWNHLEGKIFNRMFSQK